MSKKILPGLLVALSFVVAAVLFLMSELEPENFGWFNLSWAGVIFAGISGIALLFGALAQNSVVLKKLQLLLSGILLVVAAILVISALALPKNLVLPILLVVVSVLLVLGRQKVGHGRQPENGLQKLLPAQSGRGKEKRQRGRISLTARRLSGSFLSAFSGYVPRFFG